jgi:hypothetical protein
MFFWAAKSLDMGTLGLKVKARELGNRLGVLLDSPKPSDICTTENGCLELFVWIWQSANSLTNLEGPNSGGILNCNLSLFVESGGTRKIWIVVQFHTRMP